jgi:cytochrome bd ubiquinol oxidase subunit I
MLTKNGISPTVSTLETAVSLGVFVALYAALATIDLLLMLRYARRELPGGRGDGDGSDSSDIRAEDAPVPSVQY